MGEITIGTVVSTPNGSTAKVTNIYPQGKKDIYTVKFSDGSQTRCCLEHLWECYVPNDLKYRRGSTKRVVNTSDILKILKNKSKNVNISIDLITPINSPAIDVDIPPYLLGVILGDGGITQKIVISSNDDQIINKCSNLLNYGYEIRKITSSKYDFSLNTIEKSSENVYIDYLKKYKLFGLKSDEKFIPDEYKNCNIEQKHELLKGLFDTDGTISKTGTISYSTSSEQLAIDMQELLWSIGAKCSITTKTPFYKNKNGEKITGKVNYILHVNYKHDTNLFSLDRKLSRINSKKQPNQYRRQIVSVEYYGEELAQCISIDSEDHLYITDDYIITHNTFLAIYLALKEILTKGTPHHKLIIVKSAVQTRDMGFTKGTREEKEFEYVQPYISICKELFPSIENPYQQLIEQGIIEFMSTSFMRGITFNNSIIVCDEMQQGTFQELDMVATRVGEDSRIIFSGDYVQSDLKKTEKTGFHDLLKIVKEMPCFTNVEFTVDDVVRSGFVKEFILTKLKLGL